MKKNVLLMALGLLFANSAFAQVMWNLKGGLMSVPYSEWYNDEGSRRIDWMAGLELEIPLSNKLNLETGLRYKNHYALAEGHDERSYLECTNHIELPLRLTYKYPLSEDFMLRAGVGPYASFALDDMDGSGFESRLVVGLEPAVAVDWSVLSLGLSYNLPCFHKGYDDMNNNGVMVTLGIRFGSHVWEYVGGGIVALDEAMRNSGTYDAINNMRAAYEGNSDVSTYSSYNSYNNNSSTHSDSGSTGSASEQQSLNTDRNTYSNYEGQLIKMNTYWETQYNDSSRRSIQQNMRNIRTKWESRGKKMRHSEWEDWNGKKR